MKKLISFLMSVLLMIGICSPLASIAAAGEAETRLSAASKWDGTYAAKETALAHAFEGEGTEASPYLLKNATDVAMLAVQARAATANTEGKYYKLTCDVDIDNKEWEGIGLWDTDANKFAGNFDGDGHVIFNLALKNTQTNGFFGTVGNGAVIKNLGIANGDIYLAQTKTGSLIGLVRGNVTVSNCFSRANINFNANGFVGGLIGNIKSGTSHIIENCYYSGTFKVGTTNTYPTLNHAFGGLVGACWDGSNVITNCYFTGKMEIKSFVQSTTDTGGNLYQHSVAPLFGALAWASTTASITDCVVGGTLSYTNEKMTETYTPAVGKLIGHSLSVLTVTDCKDGAAVTMNGADVTAAIGNGVATENQPQLTTVSNVTVPLAEGSKCFMIAVASDVNDGRELGVTTDEVDGPIGEITLPTAPAIKPSYTSADADEMARYNAASKWDGTVYSVNSLDEVYKFEGKGTEKSPYLLNSADDVAKLAANVRFSHPNTNYQEKYFLLTVDLDFQNNEWWGIGGCFTSKTWNDDAMFTGIFDGGGHVVYNFNLANKNSEGKQIQFNGFFGYAGSNECTIKNFGIMNGELFLGGEGLGPTRTAALIGASRHDIVVDNCFNNANITFVFDGLGEPRVGGLIGAMMNSAKTERTISNCYNTGDITLYSKGLFENCLGGIVGYLSDGTRNDIINCYNTGDLTLYCDSEKDDSQVRMRAVGSIVGSFAWKATYGLKDCYAGGTITYNNVNNKYTAPIGSLVGYVDKDSTFTMTDCSYAESLKDYPTVAYIDTAAPTATKIASVTIPTSETKYFVVKVAPVVPEDDNNGNDQSNNNNNNTNNDVQTDSSAQTDAITTSAVDTDESEKKGGCGSIIALAPVGALAATVACVALKKRKED